MKKLLWPGVAQAASLIGEKSGCSLLLGAKRR